MDRDKLSYLMKKAQVFVTGLAEGVSDETVVKELEAMLLALETHKNSADHDSDPHVWTALNRFLQVVEVAGLLPTSDASNIGSASRMFGKGWISELSSLRFREGNVLGMSGMFVLTKQTGKFAVDVLATDTRIDFGQALTVGDYLLLRAENKMEYMRVGSLVENTTYNVTRNLDGSGANDWPAESVYFVRGHAGDGWLELSAVDEERFSLFLQGQNWNQTTEIVRIGLLDGWQSAGLTGYGFALGDYANQKFLTYNTATNKFLMSGEMHASSGVLGDLDVTGVLNILSGKLTGLYAEFNEEGLNMPAPITNGNVLMPGFVWRNEDDKKIAGGIRVIRGYDVDFTPKMEIWVGEHPRQTPYVGDIELIATSIGVPIVPLYDWSATSKQYVDGLIGEWQSWTPICTGWSSYWQRHGRYKILGDTLYFSFYIQGTSNSTNTTVTLPAGKRSKNVWQYFSWVHAGAGMDNGAALAIPCRADVQNNSTQIKIYKDFSGANWTASGQKIVIVDGWCEIQ